MTVGSPLGKYGQIVAASLAVLIVVGALAGHILAASLAIDAGSLEFLRLLAGVAIGAVFGATATINGVKPAIAAAHTRLDAVHAPGAVESAEIVAHEHQPPDSASGGPS